MAVPLGNMIIGGGCSAARRSPWGGGRWGTPFGVQLGQSITDLGCALSKGDFNAAPGADHGDVPVGTALPLASVALHDAAIGVARHVRHGRQGQLRYDGDVTLVRLVQVLPQPAQRPAAHSGATGEQQVAHRCNSDRDSAKGMGCARTWERKRPECKLTWAKT